MMSTSDPHAYYHQLLSIDISTIAHDLLSKRITRENHHVLECDCPHHASNSKRSLHIDTAKQLWFCFGCQVGGNVLQLVEFVKFGAVTRGISGKMPQSHRDARDFLAKRVGLPPLSSYGLNKEQLERLELNRSIEQRIFSVYQVYADFCHIGLRRNQRIAEWLYEKCHFELRMLERFRIGYAENIANIDRILLERLNKSYSIDSYPISSAADNINNSNSSTFTYKDLIASGLFRPNPNSDQNVFPVFLSRIIFPYWSQGHIVSFIARRTPWTPNNNYEIAKYKKLPLYNEHSNSHVSRFVSNSRLFGEDSLLTKTPYVLITEGITDAYALLSLDFPVISPVTVHISEQQWEGLLPRLLSSQVQTVYICMDNEISSIGLRGALKAAAFLEKHNLRVRIVTLPLEQHHLAARRELLSQYGIAVGDNKKLIDVSRQLTDEKRVQLDRLKEAAKIDVGEYISQGHSREEFQQLIDSALLPIEFSIQKLKDCTSDIELESMVSTIIAETCDKDQFTRKRVTKSLLDAKPGKYTKKMIESIFSEKNKERKLNLKIKKKEDKILSIEKKWNTKINKDKIDLNNIDYNSIPCRDCVALVLAATEADLGKPNFTAAAEAAFRWFQAHGARFFCTTENSPYVFYDNDIFWMYSPDSGERNKYEAKIYELTEIVPATTGGKTFYKVLLNKTITLGERRQLNPWTFADIGKNCIYINLHNKEHDILKISADKIETLKNGNNEDNVILATSYKVDEIHFNTLGPNEIKETLKITIDNFVSVLACDPLQAQFILFWLAAIFLRQFAGTLPILRFEGPANSGKTFASKLLSTLLYGRPQHKISTNAANYSDASVNPLISLDNLENKDVTRDLINFMLMVATGIIREKRKSGSDTGLVSERAFCLLNTTGVEPICGDLTETLSRTLIVNFDEKYKRKNGLIESEIIANLQKYRGKILSSIFHLTSIVLRLLAKGQLQEFLGFINKDIPSNNKNRCNEYFGLMWLFSVSSFDEDLLAQELKGIRKAFLHTIETFNVESMEMARESNPISRGLELLFRSYVSADKLNSTSIGGRGPSPIESFTSSYHIEFEIPKDKFTASDENNEFFSLTTKPVSIGILLGALRKISSEFKLIFPYTSPMQLAKRIANDINIIENSGFIIKREISDKRNMGFKYIIKNVGQITHFS